MKITARINISKEDYKKAIADGWNNYYDEEIEPDDVGVTNSTEDFQRAIPFMSQDVFESVSITGE